MEINYNKNVNIVKTIMREVHMSNDVLTEKEIQEALKQKRELYELMERLCECSLTTVKQIHENIKEEK
jgi:hypothetical protein